LRDLDPSPDANYAGEHLGARPEKKENQIMTRLKTIAFVLPAGTFRVAAHPPPPQAARHASAVWTGAPAIPYLGPPPAARGPRQWVASCH
jgi:hypothetical protein